MGIFDKLRFASKVATKDWSSGGWDGTFPPFWEMPTIFSGTGNISGQETIENDFIGYVEGAYKRNGPIFSCIAARQFVFSQARFAYRRFEKGHAGDLFSDKSLKILEEPWPGGTTGELLVHMEQDASLAGNSYWTKTDDAGRHGKAANGEGLRLSRLRPDWVTIIVGHKRTGSKADPNSIDAKVLGYVYRPPLGEEIFLGADEVAHFSPIPDPTARYRGMSWITPILSEIEADNAAILHKKGFLQNAAVPNMVVKFDKETDEDDFEGFVAKFKSGHEGAWNAYKTLFLMGGADVTPLTHDFKQMEFNQTIGKGESRIASAAGVPPTWVGFSEGLQGSGLNAGNFAAARRRFADGTIRPLWQMAAASLSVLLDDVPHASHLWYDERDIAFLREDELDRAEIFRIDMNAVDAGIKAGFEPDAVIEATRGRDLGKLLKNHTGLVSVQMQPPLEVRDPVREAARDAELQQIQAMVIQTLTTAGATLESATAAVLSGDFTKLKKEPLPDPAAPGGGATATRTASGASPPKKPGQTAQGKPTGPKKPGVQSSQQTDKPEKEPRDRGNDSSNQGK